MAQIDINFTQDSGGADNGSSNQFLISVLTRLNAAIEKLDRSATRSSSATSSNSDPFRSSSQGFNKAVEEFNYAGEKALRDLGNKIGSTLGTTIAAAVGITAVRYLNNQANAIMGRATASGNFIASAIGGNANSSFGSYTSNLFNIERQRQIANTNALAEGAGGVVGAVGGGVVGAALGFLRGGVAGAVGGITKGAMSGAGIGVGAGDYLAASKSNQYTEQIMLAAAARSKLLADASVTQWQSGFSRWGGAMTSQTIVPGAIAGNGHDIMAPLQAEFTKRYSSSQNFKGIQEGIAPFMTANPLDIKNGNLDKVAQNFLKAGFAASDFSRLTLQASQYSAVSGKNIEGFSKDVLAAREKFGNAFDLGANQTSLNLMTAGFGKDQAQSLAYQAQFNPGVAGNVSMLANSGYSDFYQRKFLGSSLGFDVNKSLAAGTMVGASDATKEQYKKDIANVLSGKSYSTTLALANAAGFSPERLSSLLQNQVAEQKSTGKDANNSPAQDAAYTSGTVANLLSNVQNMTVTAQMVTVINNGGASQHVSPKQSGMMIGNTYFPMAPIPHSASTTPTKQ